MTTEIIGAVLLAIFTISGGIFSLYKMMNTIKHERQEENEKILMEAKAYTEQKVATLEQELKYHKEIHEGKVAELSQKIEELREEMRRHHSQLVNLLTEMIKEKKD